LRIHEVKIKKLLEIEKCSNGQKSYSKQHLSGGEVPKIIGIGVGGSHIENEDVSIITKYIFSSSPITTAI
jgi:hypothetical protein